MLTKFRHRRRQRKAAQLAPLVIRELAEQVRRNPVRFNTGATIAPVTTPVRVDAGEAVVPCSLLGKATLDIENAVKDIRKRPGSGLV